MQKYSKQRELILNSLKSRFDHPTAEMLYMDIKKEMPEIGIATIYRNLVSLYEANEILKINIGKDADRFDGNTSRHFHYICDHCKELYDVFISEEESNVLEKMIGNISANPEQAKITINGICNKCKEEVK